MKKEILRVENLNTNFAGERALSNFRINLYKGEVLGVIGLNGSGKTTFVKVLSGVCQMDSGSIYLDNKLVNIQSIKESKKLGIYAVQKENMLISNLTVAENIEIVKPKKIKNIVIREKEMNHKIRSLLHEFELDITPNTLASKLSKGQQVFIEILKAYILNARLIILDDIIGLFTYKERLKLEKILMCLKEKEISLMITDYKFQSEMNIFDRIAVIREGKTVKILHKEELDKELITNLAVGYEYKESFARSTNEIGQVVLELNNISVDNTLKNINFSVSQGEILGVFDMEGQSAIELVRLLSGKVKKYEGTVYIEQAKINLDSIQNAVNKGIGIVSDGLSNDQLFRNMSATENAFFPLLKKASGPLGYVSNGVKKFMSKECISLLDLPDEVDCKEVSFLGKDVESKLLINKWILKQSQIIIIDNLTIGADILTKEMIYSILNKACSTGIGILFITSDISEMVNICNRILVLKNSEIQGDFTVNDMTIKHIYETIL